MAVFMIPMGSEADYRFNTLDGLLDIGQQADCKRLLAVCCNRPHFDTPSNDNSSSLVKMQYDSAQVQAELSPVALSLKPAASSAGSPMDEAPIPFMAIGQGSYALT